MDTLLNALASNYKGFSHFVDRRSNQEKEAANFLKQEGAHFLKHMTDEQKRKIIHEKAQTYESFFMGRFFQPLFESMSKNVMGSAPSEGIWQGMLAQEYAKNSVKMGQGIGLTKKIEHQLFEKMGLLPPVKGGHKPLDKKV